MRSRNSESSQDSHSDGSSEHYFVPISSANFSQVGPENRVISIRSKRLFSSQTDNSLLDNHPHGDCMSGKYDD
ncbi:hypothetical protein SLEP1_g11097 [Rubroshorea leprosula]|uniref:Uncharacterized protein n=1 Tax=Rubroshorea leprosula TaxID=152421 RepID=A0AAV5IA78_9ROSI|nr:hypothetical protein SLEP1_g11097 [Rubroshorea leprosula]